MESLSFPQKLCALKSCVPSFIVENPRTRNKSHSPQPPMRKRLYSEDFTFNLLDTTVKKEMNLQRETPRDLRPDGGGPLDFENPILEEARVFPENIDSAGEKTALFKDDMDSLPRNSSVFDLGMTALQEEGSLQEQGEFLPEQEGKTDFKVKDYFTDIFDSQKKLPLDSILGKPNLPGSKFGDPLPKFLGKRPSDSGKRNLKVQEYSTYLFKSKRVKSTSKAGKSEKRGRKTSNGKTSTPSKKKALDPSKQQKTQKVSSDKRVGLVTG